MVDSINGTGPVSTLLRAQSSAPITAATTSQLAAQKIFDTIANGAKPSTVQQGAKTAGTNSDRLPRGSIVDVLV